VVTFLLVASFAVTGGLFAQIASGLEGFRDEVVLSGLQQPTDVAFGGDGQVLVAEKRGTVQLFESLDDPTPSLILDHRTEVNDYWDRGLLGIALAPGFPEPAWLYLIYTEDAPPGETPPWWGVPSQEGDACPDPPGALVAGCVASGVIARVAVGVDSRTTGEPEILLSGWCQQFRTHSVGDLVFGPDGALYASGGDGAGAHTVDTGQLGHEYWGGNPCGDPADEGGALRAQDLLTAGDPVGFNGAILRLDPVTGEAAAGNPLVGVGAADDDRIIAFGLRNPFRFAADPTTGSIYIADVGWSTFEEIDRIADPVDPVVENFGWPCREGPAPQSGYAVTALCQLLGSGGAAVGTVTDPILAIGHGSPADPQNCGSVSPFLTGIAFGGTSYPPPWGGSLFVVDGGSGCVWALPIDDDGLPDPDSRLTLPLRLAGAVALVAGPDGDLFYPSLGSGTIHRLRADPGLLFADGFESGGLDTW
jgi:glucose/arabinose dehydrogenase